MGAQFWLSSPLAVCPGLPTEEIGIHQLVFQNLDLGARQAGGPASSHTPSQACSHFRQRWSGGWPFLPTPAHTAGTSTAATTLLLPCPQGSQREPATCCPPLPSTLPGTHLTQSQSQVLTMPSAAPSHQPPRPPDVLCRTLPVAGPLSMSVPSLLLPIHSRHTRAFALAAPATWRAPPAGAPFPACFLGSPPRHLTLSSSSLMRRPSACFSPAWFSRALCLHGITHGTQLHVIMSTAPWTVRPTSPRNLERRLAHQALNEHLRGSPGPSASKMQDPGRVMVSLPQLPPL